MAHTQDSIEQIKADAENITRRRLEDDGVDFHRIREAEINAMEGVTAATPVLEAARLNPSEPGLANFQTLSHHEGPKNVHAADNNSAPTDESVTSAAQAAKKGTNSTK